MRHNWKHTVAHVLAHQIGHQLRHGHRSPANKSRGSGAGLIVLGILLLPVPILGLPLILFGIAKSVAG